MAKFKFECETCEGTKTTAEFEAATWLDALDHFVKFLRGSGYLLENDSVGINTAKHPSAQNCGNWNLTYFQESE